MSNRVRLNTFPLCSVLRARYEYVDLRRRDPFAPNDHPYAVASTHGTSFCRQAARSRASVQVYHPLATLKCEGTAFFRSQGARDLACLLDVNPAVTAWTCMPLSLETAADKHVPDFGVFVASGNRCFFDAQDRVGDVDGR